MKELKRISLAALILVCMGLISYYLLTPEFVLKNFVLPDQMMWLLGGLVILIFGINTYRDFRTQKRSSK